MDKQYAKYMTWGKQVKTITDGNVYKLIENMDADKDTVLAINVNNWERYRLLKAWSGNQVGVTDEQRKEMEGYVETLFIDSVVPHNKIRFITPDYKELFEVKDLEDVLINGEPHKVAYIDEAHFTFVGESLALYGGCLHICQFAEICERNKHVVAAAA